MESKLNKPHDGQGNKTEIIELLIPEHTLLSYALLAHEQDITLNAWFIKAVTTHLEGVTDGKENSNK